MMRCHLCFYRSPVQQRPEWSSCVCDMTPKLPLHPSAVPPSAPAGGALTQHSRLDTSGKTQEEVNSVGDPRLLDFVNKRYKQKETILQKLTFFAVESEECLGLVLAENVP